MAFKVLEDACIGCGACEYACPGGALSKTDSFLGLFIINSLTCNDCADCVPLCPVDAIVPDPVWPVCMGHGCPLTSHRLEGVECAYWHDLCPTCGTTMWQPPGSAGWECPKCGMGMKVSCPKGRHLRGLAPSGTVTS